MEGGLNSYAGRPKTKIFEALDMKILGHPDVGSTQDDQTPEWPFLGCDYFTIIQALLLFRIHTRVSREIGGCAKRPFYVTQNPQSPFFRNVFKTFRRSFWN